ncbi:hypothetical protein [Lysobacter fragariae]
MSISFGTIPGSDDGVVERDEREPLARESDRPMRARQEFSTQTARYAQVSRRMDARVTRPHERGTVGMLEASPQAFRDSGRIDCHKRKGPGIAGPFDHS